jgi:crossover junction endodeoxyribonuclease RuvC
VIRKPRVIIGIDPGSLRTGYGIVALGAGSALSCVTWGVIKTDPEAPFADRLFTIHQVLSRLIVEHAPDEAVIEKVFLAKNASSALKLGQARGAAIVTCRMHGVLVSEYSAKEIKSSATGYGAATKEQVAGMVAKLFHITEKLPPDASDALAMAFCGATTRSFTVIS